MQVSVEVTSKIQRRVNVVVPVEKLDPRTYDQRIIKIVERLLRLMVFAQVKFL